MLILLQERLWIPGSFYFLLFLRSQLDPVADEHLLYHLERFFVILQGGFLVPDLYCRTHFGDQVFRRRGKLRVEVYCILGFFHHFLFQKGRRTEERCFWWCSIYLVLGIRRERVDDGLSVSLGHSWLPFIFLIFLHEIVFEFFDISADLLVDKIGLGLANGAELFEGFCETILSFGGKVVDFHLTSSEIKILNLLKYWEWKWAIFTFIETF